LYWEEIPCEAEEEAVEEHQLADLDRKSEGLNQVNVNDKLKAKNGYYEELLPSLCSASSGSISADLYC
jgi:hypothetical protein